MLVRAVDAVFRVACETRARLDRVRPAHFRVLPSGDIVQTPGFATLAQLPASEYTPEERGLAQLANALIELAPSEMCALFLMEYTSRAAAQRNTFSLAGRKRARLTDDDDDAMEIDDDTAHAIANPDMYLFGQFGGQVANDTVQYEIMRHLATRDALRLRLVSRKWSAALLRSIEVIPDIAMLLDMSKETRGQLTSVNALVIADVHKIATSIDRREEVLPAGIRKVVIDLDSRSRKVAGKLLDIVQSMDQLEHIEITYTSAPTDPWYQDFTWQFTGIATVLHHLHTLLVDIEIDVRDLQAPELLTELRMSVRTTASEGYWIELKNLHTLSLDMEVVSADSQNSHLLEIKRAAPALRSLTLRHDRDIRRDMQVVRTMTQLTQLSITSLLSSQVWADLMRSLPHLTSFTGELSDYQTTLATVKSPPPLEHLSISSSKGDDFGSDEIATAFASAIIESLPTLLTLTLHSGEDDDAPFPSEKLWRLPVLRELVLTEWTFDFNVPEPAPTSLKTLEVHDAAQLESTGSVDSMWSITSLTLSAFGTDSEESLILPSSIEWLTLEVDPTDFFFDNSELSRKFLHQLPNLRYFKYFNGEMNIFNRPYKMIDVYRKFSIFDRADLARIDTIVYGDHRNSVVLSK